MFRFEKSFWGVDCIVEADEQFAPGLGQCRGRSSLHQGSVNTNDAHTELMERAAFLRIYKQVELHFVADCTAEEILVGFCLDICLLSKISSGGC